MTKSTDIHTNKTTDPFNSPLSRLLGVERSFPILLAPMAGVTDLAFREICMSRSADFCYTEMVSAKGLFYNNKNTHALLEVNDLTRPCGIQLFGHEPKILAQMTRKLCDDCSDKIRLIDINMGCPAPKIVSNGEGSALMRNVPLAAACIEAVVRASSLPVTVKFRLGWNEHEKNALEFAKMCEDSGASAITVHGRTREQMYSGVADWDAIARIKSALHIPVIGNGDVFSGQDALRMIRETHVDGIMVARGARGNPFIFEEIHAALSDTPAHEVTAQDRVEAAIRHIELNEKYGGSFVSMRKHIAWYTRGLPGGAQIREQINSCADAQHACDLLSCFAGRGTE